MQISVPDIIKTFKVEEKTIYGWIAKKQMPCVKINEQYRFNYIELLEWVMQNRIPLTADILSLGDKDTNQSNVLANALKTGGVYDGVEGRTREEVLKNMVELLPLPAETDKTSLLEMFLAREAMESTAVGNGIALPHVRNPVVLNIDEPLVALCFLKNAVDFGAFDGRPVFILFVLISPSIRMHLLLLSRLSFCIQDPRFQKYLRSGTPREQLIAEAIVIESRLVAQTRAGGKRQMGQRT